MTLATTTTKPKVEKKVVQEPTRADVKAAMTWVAKNTNLVATLWGPTASGKTRMVHDWAEEMGGECVTVLLSQHTPDEIAGFQTEIDGQLVAQKPFWFRQAEKVTAAGKPVVLLFDELGLARAEVTGAIFTFFRDRHLHDHKLEGEVYVVAAMNPATLLPAYMSRSLLMHVPADRGHMLSIAKHPLAIKAAQAGNLTVNDGGAYSNDAPPYPETVTMSSVDALNQTNKGGFWHMTEPARRTVIQGLVPRATLEELLRDHLDVSVLARQPKELAKTLEGLNSIDILNIIEGLLETLPQLNPKEIADLIITIQDEVLYNDIDNLLEPFMAVERPEHIQNAALTVDNDYLWKQIEKRGFVKAKNGELSGTAIDRWIAQRGETS